MSGYYIVKSLLCAGIACSGCNVSGMHFQGDSKIISTRLFDIQKKMMERIEAEVFSDHDTRVGVLAAEFSELTGLDSREVKAILLGKFDRNIHFRGQPFNTRYSSESKFDDFSKGGVQLLICHFEDLKGKGQDFLANHLRKVFAWLGGGARAVIDLSDDDMLATDFGACVTPVELSLSEPWNISIPVPYTFYSGTFAGRGSRRQIGVSRET